MELERRVPPPGASSPPPHVRTHEPGGRLSANTESAGSGLQDFQPPERRAGRGGG